MPAAFPPCERRTVPRRLGPSTLLLLACLGLQAAAVRTPPLPPLLFPPPSLPSPPLLPTFTCCSGQASCGVVNDNVTCAVLRDLYYATSGGGWSPHTGGWTDAAAGIPTDFCATFDGTNCSASGLLTELCVDGWK